MVRILLALGIVSVCTGLIAEDAGTMLPTPDYTRAKDDPDWLAYAAQFHGHLGPWATAGIRLGIAGRRAVDARGYFDVNITCEGPFEKPPKSCFLDGVQVATGATWGKRNIRWVPGDQVAVRVENTRTGKTVCVRPTEKLMELLGSLQMRAKAQTSDEDHGQEDDHDHGENPVEALARQVATLPDGEILTVERPQAE